MEEEKQICPSTVRNVAHDYDFKAYTVLAKPPLDADQMNERLDFALAYEERTMHFWMNCIFVDETRHSSDSAQRTPMKGFGGLRTSSWTQNI